MSEPGQPAEATFRSRVVRESKDVEGGAATNIQMPHRERAREGGRRQTISELEIEREKGDIVAHAHLDIRPESQVSASRGLEMHSGIELIRLTLAPARTPPLGQRKQRTNDSAATTIVLKLSFIYTLPMRNDNQSFAPAILNSPLRR